MTMVEQFAKENGFDVSATESLFRYIMIRLKEPKHLEAFMSDAGSWTEAAIKSWNDNSKKFCDKYFTDEEYQKQVNENVFNGLVS